MTNLLSQVGGAARMVSSSAFWTLHARFEWHQAVEQSVIIGVESFGVVALTSLFTGMVLALQAGNTIGNSFGDPIFVGTIVAFSLIRELGRGSLFPVGRGQPLRRKSVRWPLPNKLMHSIR